MKFEERFKELRKNKCLEKISNYFEKIVNAMCQLEEFKYLTYVMLLFSVEIHNYNNVYNLLETGIKKEINFFKEFLEKYRVNFSKELEKSFEERYNKFNKIHEDLFVKNYDEKYDKLCKVINSCVKAMLILASQFENIINHLQEKDDFIKNLGKITSFFERVRTKVRPRKVSKYQHYVGVNLKNYKKANIGG